jgi:hypothetical protein
LSTFVDTQILREALGFRSRRFHIGSGTGTESGREAKAAGIASHSLASPYCCSLLGEVVEHLADKLPAPTRSLLHLVQGQTRGRFLRKELEDLLADVSGLHPLDGSHELIAFLGQLDHEPRGMLCVTPQDLECSMIRWPLFRATQLDHDVH